MHEVYRLIISPQFGYLGEVYRTPSWPYLALSLGLIVCLYFLLPATLGNISDFIAWILSLVLFIPAIAVPQFTGIAAPELSIIVSLTAGVCGIAIVVLLRFPPSNMVPVFPASFAVVQTAIALISIATYVYLLSVSGLALASPNLDDVYAIRDGYRQTVAESGALIGYLVRLQGNVINPLILIRGLYGGPKWLLAVGLIGQWLIYSITGFKTVLLSGFAIFAIALLFRLYGSLRLSTFIGYFAGFSILALVIDKLTASMFLSTVFIYRTLLMPGTLPSAYFDYFSHREFYKWEDSVISFWSSSSNHNSSLSYLIGQYMTGNSEVSANSHLIADGYGNFGFLGVAIELIVLLLILFALASSARGLPLPVICSLSIAPLFALINSSPITSIISNGFLALIICCAVLPRAGWRYSDQPIYGPTHASPSTSVTF
ncbi:hypothetical protein [Dietzia sp. IN118]|uniref:hypothetical protein n=1 Tax=Dietzia sp. IN118 TaxID=3061631 RepID=UPI00293A3DDB|nr:hypothetical protein [Dietzia sp. IN118]MDV3354469.1 hypothetical protein [Dietzia sp. IN118]